MLLRPSLLLLRRRLIFVSVCSMLGTLAAFSATSAESFTDLGVFWHHFCGCPPDPADVHIVLYSFTVICLYMGGALGVVTGLTMNIGGNGLTGSASGPVTIGDTRFLLTRPTLRQSVLFPPLLIATLALAVIPALCYLILLGWLWLVHAPALAHLAASFSLAPHVRKLGTHLSFWQMLSAVHFARYYAAAISTGLCAYAFMAAQRWLILSPNKTLRTICFAPWIAFVFSPMAFMFVGLGTRSRLLLWTTLWAPKGQGLEYQPTWAGIGLHLAIAAAVLYGCRRLIATVEL
ncbi:hypothetical protein SAMN05421770_1011093 [Granulicella rosea]|uniref:Uncharacterized protein n=1 Tax=Granulicella rosea TaxID=474952 RepID=A0A239EPT9_9BACT|nr:hypothetical protein [Granulicella rosea]SNS46589.1 hypothetical protein SAMN05421770_1011093 [Granulicella rosea]